MAKAAHLRLVEAAEPAAEPVRARPLELSSGWDARGPDPLVAPGLDARDLQGLLFEEFNQAPRPPLKWVVVSVVLGCAACWAGIIAGVLALFA